ncbi:hypothetical protein, partial [Butyricicoccus sp.]
SGVLFLLAIVITSVILLLFYTLLEVSTKFGMESKWIFSNSLSPAKVGLLDLPMVLLSPFLFFFSASWSCAALYRALNVLFRGTAV